MIVGARRGKMLKLTLQEKQGFRECRLHSGFGDCKMAPSVVVGVKLGLE